MNTLIIDTELATCVPAYDGSRDPRYRYCEGWRDFSGMELACICAIDTADGIPRLWLGENVREFLAVALSGAFDCLVTFNGDKFDWPLILNKAGASPAEAASIHAMSYDLLAETWTGAGLDPLEFRPRTHGGFGLEALAVSNLGRSKTSRGEVAPKSWQDGRHAEVINYCFHDVWLTAGLLQLVELEGFLLTKVGNVPVLRPSAKFSSDDSTDDDAA